MTAGSARPGPVLLAPAGLAALAARLSRPLVVVDAGCRWGVAGAWEALRGHVEVIGFDPDADECARLERTAGGAGRRYVPLALGARTGPARLHLTADPACASLYPPAAGAVRERPGLAVARPAGVASIPVIRLDEWMRGAGVERIDALKLDVQGAELDVLEGAGAALESVRAVVTEVSFNEMYAGQPLFADVDRLLRARGFVLWRLRDLAHYGLADAPSAFPSPEHHWFDSRPVELAAEGGQLYWANASYVRADLAFGDAPRPWEELVRDAVVAGALAFWDLAGRALGRALEDAPAAAGRALRAAIGTPG